MFKLVGVIGLGGQADDHDLERHARRRVLRGCLPLIPSSPGRQPLPEDRSRLQREDRPDRVRSFHGVLRPAEVARDRRGYADIASAAASMQSQMKNYLATAATGG
jgi:hypothetical protein